MSDPSPSAAAWLPGFDIRHGRVAAGAVVLLVILSRLALMPDGPWEQDEAIFASALHDYDVVRHRPHPPGFAGFIALGSLVMPVLGDALLALRVVSIAASVVAFIALARLLARVARPSSATAGALLVTFVPLVWAHAPRAFTTTPAVACMLWTLDAWTTPRPRRGRTRIGWIVLALGIAIRPQLLPIALAIAAAGIVRQRSRREALMLDAGLGVATLAAFALGTVLAGGGWSSVLSATMSHLDAAARAAARPVALEDFGVVRGLGGTAPALAVTALSLLGMAWLLVTRRATGLLVLLIVGVTGWTILRLHAPAIPRYGVALVYALAVPVVVAIDRLTRRVAPLVLVALTGLVIAQGLPLMLAMHRTALPPWAALRFAARHGPSQYVYSHGKFSFVRYASDRGLLEAPVVDVSSFDHIDPLLAGSAVQPGRTVRFLPGPAGCVRDFDDFPPQLRMLSQRRFEHERLAIDPVLLGPGIYNPETQADGRRFAWISDSAQLRIPAGSDTLWLELRVTVGMGAQRLAARHADATLLSTVLSPGSHRVPVSLPRCDRGCRVALSMPDARTSNRDGRPLAARLLAAWAAGPDALASPRSFSPGDRTSVEASWATLDGFHGPERFGERLGAWTKAEATIELWAHRTGQLTLWAARPAHVPGPVVIRTGGRERSVQVAATPTRIDVEVEPTDASVVEVSLHPPTFVPTEIRPQSSDRRRLGMIVYSIEYMPAAGRCPQ